MQNDLDVIIARQLKEAREAHAHALNVIERIQRTLNRRTVLLQEAGARLIDIEEIHNNLPE